MVTAKYHGQQGGEISEADHRLEEEVELTAQVAIIVYRLTSLWWPPACAGGDEILKEVAKSIINWVAYL